MYLRIIDLETNDTYDCKAIGPRLDVFVKHSQPDKTFDKIIGEITISTENDEGLSTISFIPRNKRLSRNTKVKMLSKLKKPKTISYGILQMYDEKPIEKRNGYRKINTKALTFTSVLFTILVLGLIISAMFII